MADYRRRLRVRAVGGERMKHTPGESPAERREREATTPKPIAVPVDALQALGDEHHLGANWRCREPIERMATYGYRWTDDALEMKLPAFQWADKTAGILRYHGDRIMYQGEEGGWHRFLVWCDYDTRARAPVGVGANASTVMNV